MTKDILNLSKKELKNYVNQNGFYFSFNVNNLNSLDDVSAVFSKNDVVNTGKKVPEGENILVFEGLASQAYGKGEKSRNGYKIDQNGWDFTNYKMNPIILLQHNAEYGGIGHAVKFAVDENGLNILFYVDLNAMDEKSAYQVKNGFINAISTGHISEEVMFEHNETGERYTEGDAMEEFGWENVWKAYWGDGEILTLVVTKAQAIENSLVTIGSNEKAQAMQNALGTFFQNKAEDLKAKMENSANKEEETTEEDEKEIESTEVKENDCKDGQCSIEKPSEEETENESEEPENKTEESSEESKDESTEETSEETTESESEEKTSTEEKTDKESESKVEDNSISTNSDKESEDDSDEESEDCDLTDSKEGCQESETDSGDTEAAENATDKGTKENSTENVGHEVNMNIKLDKDTMETLENMQKHNDALNAEVTSLKSEINSMKEEMEKQNNEVNEILVGINDLMKQAKDNNDKFDNLVTNARKNLAQGAPIFKKELESTGNSFADRIRIAR